MITPVAIGPFLVNPSDYIPLKSSGTCGIYRIVNIVNGMSYVGSSKDIARRLVSHASLLASGAHHNSHLQNSYKKYGPMMFVFCIEKTCDITNLLEEEDFFIKHYRSINRSSGYNLQMGCRDDSGKRWSRQVISKISESNKRRYIENPKMAKTNSERLSAWHKNNPGIAGGPKKIYTYKHKSGITFTGCANELRRAFPGDCLKQSHLWELSSGKAKSHKGWSIYK